MKRELLCFLAKVEESASSKMEEGEAEAVNATAEREAKEAEEEAAGKEAEVTCEKGLGWMWRGFCRKFIALCVAAVVTAVIGLVVSLGESDSKEPPSPLSPPSRNSNSPYNYGTPIAIPKSSTGT